MSFNANKIVIQNEKNMERLFLSFLIVIVSISAGAQVPGISSSTRKQVSDAVDNAYNKSRNNSQRKSANTSTYSPNDNRFSSRPSTVTGKPTAAQKKATDEKAVREYNKGVDAWNEAAGSSTFNQDRINDIFNSKAKPKGVSGAELGTAAALSKAAKNQQNSELAYKISSDAFHNNSGQIKWDEVIKNFNKLSPAKRQYYYNQSVKEYKAAKYKYDAMVLNKTKALKSRVYSETKAALDEKRLNNMLKTGTSKAIGTYVSSHYPNDKTQATKVSKTIENTAVSVQSSEEAKRVDKKKAVLDILSKNCPECVKSAKATK